MSQSSLLKLLLCLWVVQYCKQESWYMHTNNPQKQKWLEGSLVSQKKASAVSIADKVCLSAGRAGTLKFTDRVRDISEPRCLSKVCAFVRHKSLLVLIVKFSGQCCAEDRSASCFLHALGTVTPEFGEDKVMCVLMPMSAKCLNWAGPAVGLQKELCGCLKHMADPNRSESLSPQVTHTVSPPVTLIDSHVSEVIYFFKTTYCVTLFLLILLFTY